MSENNILPGTGWDRVAEKMAEANEAATVEAIEAADRAVRRVEEDWSSGEDGYTTSELANATMNANPEIDHDVVWLAVERSRIGFCMMTIGGYDDVMKFLDDYPTRDGRKLAAMAALGYDPTPPTLPATGWPGTGWDSLAAWMAEQNGVTVSEIEAADRAVYQVVNRHSLGPGGSTQAEQVAVTMAANPDLNEIAVRLAAERAGLRFLMTFTDDGHDDVVEYLCRYPGHEERLDAAFPEFAAIDKQEALRYRDRLIAEETAKEVAH